MSRSNTELTPDLLHAALVELSGNGGRLPGRDVVERAGLRAKVEGDECSIYPATGNVRWKAVLQLQSIALVKAGFIQKNKGIWSITEEGEAAIEMGPQALWKEIKKRYKEWKQNQPRKDDEDEELPDPDKEGEGRAIRTTILTEEVEALATKGIQDAIRALDPYEFQDLVAALLRGMGYHTPHVAPKGKDGGIDVVAYRDPLGTQAPTILCQVKHRPASASGIADVQRLMGALQHQKSVGLFVTSGTFSSDARQAARTSHIHIELVDMARFLELWIEHYPTMDEDDRRHLRLRTIHVMAE